MPHERTIDNLILLRDTALEKAARLERQLKDEPRYYQAQTRYRVRLARERASQLQKEIDMRNREDVATTDLRQLARLCDEHAEAFGGVLKKLHAELVAARQRNNGRGPSALLLWSSLERCATRNFDGTVLRSLRGSPRIARQPTFAEQIERWMSMLGAPPNSPSSTPPSPPAEAA